MNYGLNKHTELMQFTFKWVFIKYPHIKVTSCGKVFNIKNGRQKKICINGYSRGIWIDRKFLTNLNKHIKIIK